MNDKRVLVLGVSGMLGSAVFSTLSRAPGLSVWGAARRVDDFRKLVDSPPERLLGGVDVLQQDSLVDLLRRTRPDVVLNCVGLVKQFREASDPLAALPVNAMFPHRLARVCQLAGTRVVHVSTDCVFNGKAAGRYVETDVADAEDVYGMSKYLGELTDYVNAVTLRTSIIGHEIGSSRGLVDWFLSQSGQVSGYTKAIFSGLPTFELARVIRDFVLPDAGLTGLFHVSAEPIDKYSLLKLVAEAYGKDVEIVPDETVRIDRSLDSSKFRRRVGYEPPSWPELVDAMRRTRLAV